MKTRKLLIALLVLLSVFSLVAFKKIIAVDTASVSATVTFQNVSLTVSDGNIAYGTLSAGTTKNTVSLSDTQTVTNNGNVAEDFNIKGDNSTNWTLVSNPSAQDQYSHKFCTASCSNPSNYTALTTNYSTLGEDVTVSGTKSLDLELKTPPSSSTFNEQTVNVTVQAVSAN